MKRFIQTASLIISAALFIPVNCAEVKLQESAAGPVRQETRSNRHVAVRKVSLEKGDQIIQIADKFLGLPYKFGGNTPEGFDCSGFTSYVYSEAGIEIPRDTTDQFGRLNSVRKPRRGDLVFFKIDGNKISHVGIYAGDFKFIHSPRSGKSVEYTDIRIDYWKERYAGARTFR